MIREFQIAGWRAQPQFHQLVGPAGPVAVEARSMEVLVALAQGAGEVVSREDLLRRVWGELFVEEHVLTHAIWDLRQALGDAPKRPRFIQTVPKRGYRLVAPVSWLEQGVGDTGRYQLDEPVGGGAMGVVFRAQDRRLGRAVALKFLPPEWSRDEMAKTRFLREAKTAAALDHPNLCTLLEIDETEDGRLFLVMPLYQGETLREELGRGPMAIARALSVAEQVAAGLAALHDEGIVHRDIKPGNIFLTESGEVKILDFGLAKFAGSTRLTQTGSSPGTPAYMSPERVRGEEAGPASDVWALGAMLYEALAGRHPFGAESETATFFAILNSEPEPLTELGIEEELAGIVTRALAKSVSSRFDSAEAIGQALRRRARSEKNRA